jgi:hypothetical protein
LTEFYFQKQKGRPLARINQKGLLKNAFFLVKKLGSRFIKTERKRKGREKYRAKAGIAVKSA